MKIAIVYFSGTNVTHTYALEMEKAFVAKGCEVGLLNVTPFKAREEEFPIAEYDHFIFGFPVFSDFAPKVINEWIPTLKGQGKQCAQFFTFGARTSGYAHFHTMKLLQEAGFEVVLSAEFLGRHSFNVAGWTILPERPDEGDLAVAREYVGIALENFKADEAGEFRLQKPFGYNRAISLLEESKPRTERSWTNPVRIVDVCSMCRDCEEECPTQAFNADTGESDPELCISCMRCVWVCPDDVLKVDERMKAVYQNFKQDFNLTEEMMEVKKSKIIAESWQAAA